MNLVELMVGKEILSSSLSLATVQVNIYVKLIEKASFVTKRRYKKLNGTIGVNKKNKSFYK